MALPYNVIIVEDDWIHAQLLEEWLAAFGSTFQVTGSYETCATAYTALSSGRSCDLLLLDMELQDMSGIHFFEALPVRPFTIIQTSHPEFAVEAFRLAANDYLVKPFDKERFNQAILRFLAQAGKAAQPASPAVADHLFVKSGRDTVRIILAEIVYIRSDQHYLHIVHGDSQTITLMSMSQLQPSLPENQFIQVHRSYYIHFAHFTRLANGVIFLGKHEVPLGATYKKAFEEFLTDRMV